MAQSLCDIVLFLKKVTVSLFSEVYVEKQMIHKGIWSELDKRIQRMVSRDLEEIRCNFQVHYFSYTL